MLMEDRNYAFSPYSESEVNVALFVGRQVLYTGSAFDPEEIESALEAVTAKTVREACMKYIYDKCPAVVGYGESVLEIQRNVQIS